jgi:hypothetical protein
MSMYLFSSSSGRVERSGILEVVGRTREKQSAPCGYAGVSFDRDVVAKPNRALQFSKEVVEQVDDCGLGSIPFIAFLGRCFAVFGWGTHCLGFIVCFAHLSNVLGFVAFGFCCFWVLLLLGFVAWVVSFALLTCRTFLVFELLV